MGENRGSMTFQGKTTFTSDTKYGQHAAAGLAEVIKLIFQDYKTDPRVKDFLDIKLELKTVDPIQWEPSLPSRWSEVFNSDHNGWGYIDNCMKAAASCGYKYFSWNGWVYAILNGLDYKKLDLLAENLK